VTTERILSKEQTTEKGYLRRVLGVKVRDKEHRSAIRKAPYGKLLLRIERSHHASLAMWPECLRKGWQLKSFGLQSTLMRKWPRGHPRWRDYISDLVWYRLGVEPVEVSEITVDREVFGVLLGLLLPWLEKGKSGKKRSKWISMYAYIEPLYLWNCL